jgi:hypothetical protein
MRCVANIFLIVLIGFIGPVDGDRSCNVCSSSITPSPHMQEMFEAVVSGATAPEIEGVQVIVGRR